MADTEPLTPDRDTYALYIDPKKSPIITIGAGARVYANHDTVMIRQNGGNYWFGSGARVEFDGPDSFGQKRVTVELYPAILRAAANQRVKVRLYRPKAKDRGFWRRHRRFSADHYRRFPEARVEEEGDRA
ncbi:hypothetical protein [Rathayibacter sp. AY2B9]|uniref:hypothetical protein n=1 Tax=Rathayibacter sp. AY2B9 TaxID=2080572 RepID=UPI000CE91AA9|nr:hypothetical protein [Rathayibacter sp. AY2B9]PPG34512.1 hypothetical protein C5C25_00380 [Rathayibacter sp. AY2B9]